MISSNRPNHDRLFYLFFIRMLLICFGAFQVLYVLKLLSLAIRFQLIHRQHQLGVHHSEWKDLSIWFAPSI